MARFVMLPSEDGQIVVNADNAVSARSEGGSTVLAFVSGAAVTCSAPIDRAVEIVGTLRVQAKSPQGVVYFNHRFLDFAAVRDGRTDLIFNATSGASIAEDGGDQLITLLETLEREQRARDRSQPSG